MERDDDENSALSQREGDAKSPMEKQNWWRTEQARVHQFRAIRRKASNG